MKTGKLRTSHQGWIVRAGLALSVISLGACRNRGGAELGPGAGETRPPGAMAEHAKHAGQAAMQLDVSSLEGRQAQAVAELQAAEGHELSGTVSFYEVDGRVAVLAKVRGLSPGAHGFHVHEHGVCEQPDFNSAGGHFAPRTHPHGGPHDEAHHAGDLGNITARADEEVTTYVVTTSGDLTLDEGPTSAVGRSVVIHADPDDFKTQPSGASGPRIACGLIRRVQP